MPYGNNIHSPLIAVRHADLDRDDAAHSAYRSVCPACDGMGMLLVHRNQKTFQLSRVDRCIRCGQLFWYTDDTICGETPESPRDPPGAKMDAHLVDAIIQKTRPQLGDNYDEILDEFRSFLTQDDMPEQYQNRGEWGAGISYRLGGLFDLKNRPALDAVNILVSAILVRNEEYGVPFTSEKERQAAYQRLHECFPSVWDRIMADDG